MKLYSLCRTSDRIKCDNLLSSGRAMLPRLMSLFKKFLAYTHTHTLTHKTDTDNRAHVDKRIDRHKLIYNYIYIYIYIERERQTDREEREREREREREILCINFYQCEYFKWVWQLFTGFTLEIGEWFTLSFISRNWAYEELVVFLRCGAIPFPTAKSTQALSAEIRSVFVDSVFHVDNRYPTSHVFPT